MARGAIVGGLVVVALGGTAIFGWGAGWFYPCGPIDSVIKASGCRVIAEFPVTPLQALALLPSGNFLAVARGDGPDPTSTNRFVELDPSGKVLSDNEIPSLAPSTNWLDAAVSADGSMVVMSSIQAPVMVFDRATSERLAVIEQYGVGFLGFDASGNVLMDRGAGSFERPVSGTAEIYSTANGALIGTTEGTEAAPIFTNGIASAMSADGKLIAQHMETRGDSGTVAIRVADAAFPSWAGQLLVAPLGAWDLTGQMLPEISFSPDGQLLAASFDSPGQWGVDTSALIVWRLSDRKVLARVPTHNAEWRSIVWLADSATIAVTRFDLDSRDGEIAVINFDPDRS